MFATDEKTGAAVFRPAAAYKPLFAVSGIDASQPIITYCDSGHYSTGHWFVLHELLGNQAAASYDGSMHEWTKFKNPVEKETLK